MRMSKEEKIKIQKDLRIKDLKNYKWCSFHNTYHKVEAFYKNAKLFDGLQSECKVVSKLRCYKCSEKKALSTFSIKEQKLFSGSK